MRKGLCWTGWLVLWLGSTIMAQEATDTPTTPPEQSTNTLFAQPADVATAFIDGFLKNDVDAVMKTVHENAVGVETTGMVWKLERERVREKMAQFHDLQLQFGVDKLKILETNVTPLGPAMALTKVRLSVRAADDSEIAQASLYVLCVRNYMGWRVLVAGSDQQ